MAQESRSRGEVRWFSDTKGYGFIKPEDGGEDLFVHHSDIKSDGYRTLTEGAIVEFTFSVGENKKPKADDVTGPNGSSILPPSAPRRATWRRDNPSDGSGCYNCGGYGHLARDCVDNSNSFRGGGGGCYSCGQPGHFARECRSGNGSSTVVGVGSGNCYSCGGFGHLARDCRQSGGGGRFGGKFGGGSGSGGGGGGCYNCGEPGHFARECGNRVLA
ncbi:cold shock domain-containing protein 3 [Beta vulgaris subsp. vulgaris]|uniref:cold shock domain-containing protein 3 n=1 Tax=Beta vulgaris subsp. vulgaris TaxID=3555 RepID=UPI002547B5FE|nr:cold shock domain-containing protein 3 [Beta vulgaris subsp. vulgaris]